MKEIFRREKLSNRAGILNIETFGNTNTSQFFVHVTSGLGTEYRQPELQRIWERIRGSMNAASVRSQLIGQSVVHFDTTNDLIPWNFPFAIIQNSTLSVNVTKQ